MATRPTAVRGKTTKKGKLKKAIQSIMERSELIGDPSKGKGMSPGAMGGRTPIKTVEDMDITKLRNRATDIANSMNIGIGGTIGKKLRNLMDEKGKKEFDDGGVVDMTTEVDVE